MNKNIFNPTLLSVSAVLLVLSACATSPRTTSLLDQTRSDYASARSNPDVVRYAPAELQQATAAMDSANQASTKDESDKKIDQLAYLAKDKIAVANEVAKQKLAEAQIAKTARERDQMVLNQRTMEADKAKQEATQANANAQMAMVESAEAQRKTAEAQAQAAQLQAQLADLSAKQTERGLVITLGDVLFANNQANLTADGKRTVAKLADVLNKNSQRRVLVEGYTDSTGSAEYNQELSERRAQSVRSALLDQGITADRVSMRGYGKNFPVAANDSESNRQLNRRVEIVMSDMSGKIIERK